MPFSSPEKGRSADLGPGFCALSSASPGSQGVASLGWYSTANPSLLSHHEGDDGREHEVPQAMEGTAGHS